MALASPRENSELLLEVKSDEPSMYRVLLHNDDYTTMEFVVQILCTVFRKTPEDASAIMLMVHERGVGECGVYPLEIAETRVNQVHLRARAEGFPLKCTCEKA